MELGSAVEMIKALLPQEEDQQALLEAMIEAEVDQRNLVESWAFIEQWVKQQQESQ